MSKPIHDADAVARHRQHEQLPEPEEQIVPVSPRPPAENVVPVRPGYAGAARRAGCEDEYDNAMQARYGEGW